MTKKISLSKSATMFDKAFLQGESVAEVSTTHEIAREEPAAEVVSEPAPKASKEVKTARITLPTGSYLKGDYFYTPELNGKARWFGVKQLVSFVEEQGVFTLEMAEKAIKARGLMDMVQA
jgi:hypothetical protein